MKIVTSYLFLLILLIPTFANALGVPELIKGALEYHPRITEQKELRAANYKALDSAKWQYFPTPTIAVDGVNASKDDASYDGDDYALRLGLTQPIYTGGKISSNLKAAEADILASEASLKEAYEEVSLNIVSAYGEWLSAHMKGLAQAKSIAVHEKLKKQVERRSEAGIATGSDLLLANGRLQSSYADAATLVASEANALTALEVLFGRTISTEELSLDQPLPLSIGTSLATLEKTALDNNPGILRARADILSADADLRLEKTSLKPDISLRFEHQRGDIYADRSRNSENRLFLNMTSKLGAGLSSFSAIEEATIRRNAVRSKLTQSELKLRKKVRSDYALLQSFLISVEALENSLKTAVEVSDSYNRQFLVGRKSWLDVMNTARDLVSTETQLVDAQSANVLVSWRLYITALGLNSALAEAGGLDNSQDIMIFPRSNSNE